MKIEVLKNERMADFVDYCKRHRSEIDDSFLYDEDLRDFEANHENPTYIATDEKGVIVAVASLIVDDYNRRGKKGRFRIFHSEIENIECCKELLLAILGHVEGLNKLNVFVPVVNKKLMEIVEALSFEVERYSFLLVRGDAEVPALNLPVDYEIRAFRAGVDEGTWCEVRNAGFAKLQGSETPATPEMIAKMILSEDNIEGGMMIMYHKERAVGVVRGERDEYEDSPIMNIGPLAIIPEYQGKGLGRILLRASMQLAKEKGYDRTVLCVNGENERAKALYIQEGFKQVEAVICYKYSLA